MTETASIELILENQRALVRDLQRIEKAVEKSARAIKGLGDQDISIDTSGLRKARREFDETGKEALRLAKRGEKLSKEFSRALEKLDKASSNLGFDQASAGAKRLQAEVEQAGRALLEFSDKAPASLNATESELEQVAAATEKARKEFERLKKAAPGKRLTSQIGGLRNAFVSLNAAIAGLGVAAVVRTLSRLGGAAIGVKTRLDSVALTLKAVTDGSEDLDRAQSLVINTSRRLGNSIETVGKSYSRFLANTKTLSLSQSEIENVFLRVSEAAAVLGLSNEKLSRAFVGLEQVAGKGVLSMEELRQQLGEALPGVIPRLAAALGRTTGELFKAIEAGEILAEEALPGIARAMEQLAGGQVEAAARRLEASLNRVKLEVDLLAKGAVDAAEGGITRLSDSLSQLVKDNQGFSEIIGRAAGDAAGLGARTVEATGRVLEFGKALSATNPQLTAFAEAARTAFLEFTNAGVFLEMAGAIDAISFALVPATGNVEKFARQQDLATVEAADTWGGVAKAIEAIERPIVSLTKALEAPGEAAARALGEVEKSGQRLALSIEESEKRITRARREAAEDRATVDIRGAENRAIIEQTVAEGVRERLQEVVDAAREAGRDRVEALKSAIEEEVAAEREGIADRAAELEGIADSFNLSNEERARILGEALKELNDAEREAAQERIEIVRKAQEEMAKEGADRAEIEEGVKDEIVEIEKDLAEERLEIRRDLLAQAEEAERESLERLKESFAGAAEEFRDLSERDIQGGSVSVSGTGDSSGLQTFGEGADRVNDAIERLKKQRSDILSQFTVSNEDLEKAKQLANAIQEIEKNFTALAQGGAPTAARQEVVSFTGAVSESGQLALDKLEALLGNFEKMKGALGELDDEGRARIEALLQTFRKLGENATVTEQDFIRFREGLVGELEKGGAESKELLAAIGQQFGEVGKTAGDLDSDIRRLVGSFGDVAEKEKDVGEAGEEAARGIRVFRDEAGRFKIETLEKEAAAAADEVGDLGDEAKKAAPPIGDIARDAPGAAEGAGELGSRASDAAPGVSELATAAADLALNTTAVASDLTAIQPALASIGTTIPIVLASITDGREALTAGTEATAKLAETVPAISAATTALSTSLEVVKPAALEILDALAAALEDDLFGVTSEGLDKISNAIKAAEPGFKAAESGFKSLLEAAERAKEVEGLGSAVTALVSSQNVDGLEKSAAAMATFAEGLDSALKAIKNIGKDGGAVDEAQKKLEKFAKFVESQLVEALAKASAEVEKLESALGEEGILGSLGEIEEAFRVKIPEAAADGVSKALSELDRLSVKLDEVLRKFDDVNREGGG